MLPRYEYPSMGLNAIHRVVDWRYVRKIMRAVMRGETVTPILYDGETNNGNLLAGTHRLMANQILRDLGKDCAVEMVCLDEVDQEYAAAHGIDRDELLKAVEDDDFERIDFEWDQTWRP